MRKPIFTGVCTALVTPFENGRINLRMLEKLLARQMDAGIEAVVICGTTGESPTLSDTEKLELFRHAKEYAGSDCIIIAGTGSNCTEHAIALWQRNNYLNFEKGDNGTICKLAEEYATFCAKEAKFLHVKRFKNDPQLWKSLVVTAKGTPVAVIQENICGKGTVIYSYDLKIFREANHPMLDALVKKAFGEGSGAK